MLTVPKERIGSLQNEARTRLKTVWLVLFPSTNIITTISLLFSFRLAKASSSYSIITSSSAGFRLTSRRGFGFCLLGKKVEAKTASSATKKGKMGPDSASAYINSSPRSYAEAPTVILIRLT